MQLLCGQIRAKILLMDIHTLLLAQMMRNSTLLATPNATSAVFFFKRKWKFI